MLQHGRTMIWIVQSGGQMMRRSYNCDILTDQWILNQFIINNLITIFKTMKLQKLASHYCQAWENKYFAGKFFQKLNLEAKIIDLEISRVVSCRNYWSNYWPNFAVFNVCVFGEKWTSLTEQQWELMQISHSYLLEVRMSWVTDDLSGETYNSGQHSHINAI